MNKLSQKDERLLNSGTSEQIGKRETEALKFLERMKEKTNGELDSARLEEVLQDLDRFVRRDVFGVLISLHHFGVLKKMMEAAQSLSWQSKIIKFQKRLRTLYVLGNQFLFKYKKQYQGIFRELKQKLKFDQREKYTEHIARSERYQQWSRILTKFFSLELQQSGFGRRKNINLFVEHDLSTLESETFFEEIAIYWLKSELERLQKQSQSRICCRLYFQRVLEIKGYDTQTLDFSKTWPPENQVAARSNLKKNIIGYLNSNGGITCLGVEQKAKVAIIFGIPLNDKARQSLLHQLYDDIVLKIYPGDIEDENQKKQQELLENEKNKKRAIFNKKKKEYELSRYISVDFMNVYNRESGMEYRDKDKVYYVVRIKVKIGDPSELYHFIGETGMPEAYVRQDRTLKKKNVMEFYDLFYQRMKDKANGVDPKIPNEHHEQCHFRLKVKDQQTN